MTRHFLRDDDLTPAEQAEVLAVAAAMKQDPYAAKPLAGPVTVATIYDKPTLRTQASFSSGIAELGGHSMLVDGRLAGIGERESVADVARVLGRQAGEIVWRTFAQTDLEQMAAHSGVPVVNALTDEFHPCQLLADLQTLREHKGSLAGLTAAFVADPVEAATGADVLVTDTWVSMGREAESEARAEVFAPWQLNDDLLGNAADDAIALHCLPAYRGKEITADVLEGPRSVVWDEAENRRHVQKAVLVLLLAGGEPG